MFELYLLYSDCINKIHCCELIRHFIWFNDTHAFSPEKILIILFRPTETKLFLSIFFLCTIFYIYMRRVENIEFLRHNMQQIPLLRYTRLKTRNFKVYFSMNLRKNQYRYLYHCIHCISTICVQSYIRLSNIQQKKNQTKTKQTFVLYTLKL